MREQGGTAARGSSLGGARALYSAWLACPSVPQRERRCEREQRSARRRSRDVRRLAHLVSILAWLRARLYTAMQGFNRVRPVPPAAP